MKKVIIILTIKYIGYYLTTILHKESIYFQTIKLYKKSCREYSRYKVYNKL